MSKKARTKPLESRKAVLANGAPLFQVNQEGKEPVRKASTTEVWDSLSQVSVNPTMIDEDYIQGILDDYPSILPVSDFWADAEIVSLGRELKTIAGPIDNLYLTRSGRLVLIEAKLYRNSESRRKVVVQALDYAMALSRLDYDGIEKILKRNKTLNTKETFQELYEHAFEKLTQLEKDTFQDRFTRSLRDGDFLILIVGDGIKTSAIELAGALSRHPTLRYDMGLVSLNEFRGAGHKLLVPNLHTRTEVITRNHTKITWEGDTGKLYFQMLTGEEEDRIKFETFIVNLMNPTEESKAYAKDLHRKVLDSKLEVKWGGRDDQYWDACFDGIPLWRNTRSKGGSIQLSDCLTDLQKAVSAKDYKDYLTALTAFNPELRVKDSKTLSHHISYADMIPRNQEFWKIVDNLIHTIRPPESETEDKDR